jgi:hypothetical protein
MAKSTGPILAIGAITIGNATIVHGKPFDWWQPVAVGITAVIMAGAEKVAPTMTVALAYLALLAVTFVRLQPGVPSPAESFTSWLGY